MAKHNPIKTVFKEVKRFKQVRHYQSENKAIQTNLLTSLINISKDREFNNSKGVLYWLKIREVKKWSSNITGLKRTKNNFVFFGDIPTKRNGIFKPTHLLIFVFNHQGTAVNIYLFNNYYPLNKRELQNVLSKYY